MRLALPSAVLALLLAASAVHAAAAPTGAARALDVGSTHYKLLVTLKPEERWIDVKGVVTLPEGLDPAGLEFELDAGLEVEPANLVITEVTGPDAPADPRVRRWKLPADFARNRFGLRYRGILHHPLSDQTEEYSRGFRTTPGLVGPEGVYLGGESLWYPRLGDGLVEFQLKVVQSADWHVISSGNGTSRDPAGLARWTSVGAVDEIHLVGGPLHEFERQVGDVTALVYLHEPDAGLAARYLQATGQYLEMYGDLIAPHPYEKFALVENFWETGFGMPSFTLLGPQIVRFPFIITSSYPHEILHDWWGNSVFVDYESGNWCEGLTAYLADHLIQEQRGQGEAYRRTTLAKYRDHVRDARDFPLSEFRSRHDSATEAIGYGKSLMGWHALRRQLGDDAFRELLREFYKRFAFQRASFRDVQALAEGVSGADLDRFFDEWVDRTGAPELSVTVRRVRENEGSWTIDGVLAQRQAGQPFSVDVPIALQGESDAVVETVRLQRRRQSFSLTAPFRPLSLRVDPGFDVFRRLDPRETPASLSMIFGASAAVAVLPTDAPEAERAALRALAEGWATENHDVTVVTDAELSAVPEDRAVWLLGRTNRLASGLFADAAVSAAGGTWRLGAEEMPVAGRSAVIVRRHPADPEKAIGWIAADPLAAVPGLGRKLPHYGKYSWLGFQGDEPQNVLKGQGAADDSPLTVDLRAEAERAAPLPPLDLPAREPLAELPPIFRAQELLDDVLWLSDADRQGRGLGTQGLADATDWIARRFAEAGLAPGGPDGSFLQRFETSGPDGRAVEVANVVGVLKGTRPDWSDQAVLVTAHHDHLGSGWPDAHAGDAGRLHPGADDNASGVAVLVALARAFAAGEAPSRSLVFVAFTGEEAGRLGSKHWVEHPSPVPLAGVRAVVNLDTVGRLEGRPITVLGSETATEWPHVFRGIGFVTGIDSTMGAPGVEASDHQTFIERGIPAVQLFSGPHLDYHRPGDTADKVEGDSLVKVATFTKESLAYLADRPEPLTTTIGGTSSAPAAPASARKVSFGSVPDFSFRGPGVKLNGVVPGSPAEAAGLREGDVLTHLDGEEVADLREFSGKLKSFTTGQVVRARVLRGGEPLEANVELVAR